MSRFKVEIFDENDKELFSTNIDAENAIIANHNIYSNAEGFIPFKLSEYDNLKIVIKKITIKKTPNKGSL